MVNPRPLYSRGPRSPHRCVSGSCRTRCRLVSPVPEADSTKGQRKKRSQDGWGRHTSRRIALRASSHSETHSLPGPKHALTHASPRDLFVFVKDRKVWGTPRLVVLRS
jgi:hypothetical protein